MEKIAKTGRTPIIYNNFNKLPKNTDRGLLGKKKREAREKREIKQGFSFKPKFARHLGCKIFGATVA